MTKAESSLKTPRLLHHERTMNSSPVQAALSGTPSTSESSPKKYAFNPKYVVKIPRAWERKPATPFVQRTDTQKIWKRVPLQETRTLKTGAASQKFARAIKRMRPDQALLDTQLENDLYVSTKWEELSNSAERKRPTRQSKCCLEDEKKQTGSHDEGKWTTIEGSRGELLESSPSRITETCDQQTSSPTKQPVLENKSVTRCNIDENFSDMTDLSKHCISLQDGLDLPLQGLQVERFFTSDRALSQEHEESPYEHNSRWAREEDVTVNDKEFDDTNGKHQTDEICLSKNHDESSAIEQADAMIISTLRQQQSEIFTGEKTTASMERSNMEGELVFGFDNSPADGSQAHSRSPPTLDDTAFLHDFLSRARAQKAAKTASSPNKTAQTLDSPAKRTRQALASLNANASSPPKIEEEDIQERLGLEGDKTVEETKEHASSPCRRSVRTRLPQPPKAITTISSNIPVRRANGTEFVFLRRTEAQEIALTTRANTKRNKGDAIMPKLKLEALSASSPRSPIKVSTKRNGRKEVSWNEQQLEQIRKQEDDEDEVEAVKEEAKAPEETKPKMKKMKRLGTVNGTPAPKRALDESTRDLSTRRTRRRIVME